MSFLLNPLTIALLLADVRASLNLTKLSLLAIVFFVSKNYMWDVESVRWSGIFFFFFFLGFIFYYHTMANSSFDIIIILFPGRFCSLAQVNLSYIKGERGRRRLGRLWIFSDISSYYDTY